MATTKSKGEGVSSLIASLQSELENQFGEGSASSLSSPLNTSLIHSWVSSGSLAVDSALRGTKSKNGGICIPLNRQIEISGKPGAGKTSLCAQIAAEIQKKGGIVVTIDTEERIDVPYWKKLGVNVDEVIRIGAHTLEEVFNKQEAILRNKLAKNKDIPGVMIWDSLGGTSSDGIVEFDPKKKETFIQKAQEAYGRDAKLIGQGLKGLNPLISRSNMAYIYTNHLYDKMNVSYGDTSETYGGNKAKFMATIRLRLKRIGQLTAETPLGRDIIGHKVQIKVLKNNITGDLCEREGYVLTDRGFCNDYSVFELGTKIGLITGKAWKTVEIDGEEIKFQGWNGFQEKIVTHPKYAKLIAAVADVI